MNIAITLSSSLLVEKEYSELTRSVSKILAKEEFGIVYGGTDYGMMKDFADTYKSSGGEVVFGVTRERIRQIEAKAHEKIRQHDKINRLRNY